MSPRTVLICALLGSCLHSATAARILGLFPYKGASHFYVFQALLEELATRGHSVEVLSHFPRTTPLQNYTDIAVANDEDPSFGFMSFQVFEEMESSLYSNLVGLKTLTEGYEAVLSLPQVQALANASYDLVIMEMFNSDLFFGLVHKIGAPVIGFSSCQVLVWFADHLAVPTDLAYLPHIIGGHGQVMGLLERVENMVEVWLARAWYRLVIAPEAQATAERYLGPLPALADIAANTSLLFINSHFSLFGLRPLPQSVIEVGGINIKDPRPLPQDLNKIMNNSKGVIYFSMGSVMQGSSLPPNKWRMFINAFRETGRTVLWKMEEPVIGEQPNIITRPWFPQRDILAHPKTELFISHCGLLGTNEAVVSGVPLICIPMFGDQMANARFVSELEMGFTLRYAALTEQTLRAALNQTLSNKKFKKRAVEVSAAYKDRPLSALDTAVYWTEYLLRHGPRPFTGPFKQMSIWQRLGLDIAAVVFAVVVLTSSVLVCAIRWACGRKTKPEKLKRN